MDISIPYITYHDYLLLPPYCLSEINTYNKVITVYKKLIMA